jgi:pimeloyl-ACP methyl ester carboxylesterase
MPPEAISVGEVAADVEEVRRHLGVPRVALLGFSYGTRIALEYVTRFPARVDRVALQGTLGFEDGVRLPATLDSLLARVSEAAARDSVARGLVPDLRRALAERFAALERQPLEVPVARAPGDTVRVTVGRTGLQAIVTSRLADPRLPALAASLALGDTRVLGAMVAGLYRDLAVGGGSLFGRAVYCSAPASAARVDEARRQVGAALLGEVFDNIPTSRAFCRALGIAPGRGAATPSTVLEPPALFVAGTLDDRTPPGNAARAARYFATARVVTVENGGHELLPADLVQDLIVRFLWTGRVDIDWLTLPPPRFMTVAEALQPPRPR